MLDDPSTYSEKKSPEADPPALRVEQFNVLGDTVNDAIPQLSLEPLFTSAGVMDALPVLSRYTVAF